MNKEELKEFITNTELTTIRIEASVQMLMNYDGKESIATIGDGYRYRKDENTNAEDISSWCDYVEDMTMCVYPNYIKESGIDYIIIE